jgi:hypothetical protein
MPAAALSQDYKLPVEILERLDRVLRPVENGGAGRPNLVALGK